MSAGGFDLRLSLAARHVNAAARSARVHRPLNVAQVHTAPAGPRLDLAGQVADPDAPTGCIEIEVKLVRHGNEVAHFEFQAAKIPKAFGSLAGLAGVNSHGAALLGEVH